jgi:hypothetical protein
MANFFIVNNETGVIDNCVVLAENSTWQPPEGFTIYPFVPNVGIGWTLVNGEWVEPPPPQEETQPEASGLQDL